MEYLDENISNDIEGTLNAYFQLSLLNTSVEPMFFKLDFTQDVYIFLSYN